MSDLQDLERQFEDNKTLIEQREAVLRLTENKDFKEIILENFMKDEAARYVHASADPLLPPEQRADALAMAQASGHLKRFLSIIIQRGFTAMHQQEDIRSEMDSIRDAGED